MPRRLQGIRVRVKGSMRCFVIGFQPLRVGFLGFQGKSSYCSRVGLHRHGCGFTGTCPTHVSDTGRVGHGEPCRATMCTYMCKACISRPCGHTFFGSERLALNWRSLGVFDPKSCYRYSILVAISNHEHNAVAFNAFRNRPSCIITC